MVGNEKPSGFVDVGVFSQVVSQPVGAMGKHILCRWATGIATGRKGDDEG
jgi:hypothetical protein